VSGPDPNGAPASAQGESGDLGDPERGAEVGRWMESAREDLRAAAAVPGDPEFVPRHACFLAQQAAEKALKAVLVHRGVVFKWIHDLDALRNLIPDPEAWSVTRIGVELGTLTVWATEARYPGDHAPADADDAATAITSAQAVYDAVASDLARHGVPLPPVP
jgi:HEPN domain-containing protein